MLFRQTRVTQAKKILAPYSVKNFNFNYKNILFVPFLQKNNF